MSKNQNKTKIASFRFQEVWKYVQTDYYTCRRHIFIHTVAINPIAIACVLIIITTTSTTVIGITINCSNTVLCVIVISNVIVVPVEFGIWN